MALTELQLPSRATFYSKLQNAASQMDKLMLEWENIAEFIGMVGTADLDAMTPPVAAGQVRTDLVDFRTVLSEMVAFYKGESTTQTNVPATIVDKIRTM